MSDSRYVYGAHCTWNESIYKVGHLPGGLPCCPHCGSVLFEMDSEKEWWKGVDRYEADGHPGYRKLAEWSKGKCFKNFDEMNEAYNDFLKENKDAT